ncbi:MULTISPECIES: hypothetical protein [Methylosinus]|uniref:Uncharacterized protein n=1 Tax=Methylosinus trichosporium (strain ATCC 35070 / NCIMB 11131 / UNIQEM 75 / OB3b) TaxID=595536 RepID=A0A2D2D1H4_METT3|nr:MULTISPECIES: hypothetical protein [Methylosinus]ATQ68865.1 hypothetical protein CQW49_13960 [Methylosinus trichosporium OB3b]OBS52051.1 hypothetical protein A8B73_13155 [Methylosinus sp. 3S-1]
MIGVENEDIQPNHGWCHWFNWVAQIVGNTPRCTTPIEGHAPRKEGERYSGYMPLDPKWGAIKTMPRYEVSAPIGRRPVTETAKRASVKRMETAKRAKARKILAGESPRKAKCAPTEPPGRFVTSILVLSDLRLENRPYRR